MNKNNSITCPACEEGLSKCDCEINNKIKIIIDIARDNMGWGQETTIRWLNEYCASVGGKPIDILRNSEIKEVLKKVTDGKL